MGFLDSNNFTIICPKCRAKEEARVVQRGSVFGANWRSPPTLQKFTAEWQDRGAGPVIDIAKCRSCDVEAIIT